MLLPHEIRKKEFSLAMGGYARSEVKSYLDYIANNYEKLRRENDELSRRLDAATEKLDQYNAAELASLTASVKTEGAGVAGENTVAAAAILGSAVSSLKLELDMAMARLEEIEAIISGEIASNISGEIASDGDVIREQIEDVPESTDELAELDEIEDSIDELVVLDDVPEETSTEPATEAADENELAPTEMPEETVPVAETIEEVFEFITFGEPEASEEVGELAETAPIEEIEAVEEIEEIELGMLFEDTEEIDKVAPAEELDAVLEDASEVLSELVLELDAAEEIPVEPEQTAEAQDAEFIGEIDISDEIEAIEEIEEIEEIEAIEEISDIDEAADAEQLDISAMLGEIEAEEDTAADEIIEADEPAQLEITELPEPIEETAELEAIEDIEYIEEAEKLEPIAELEPIEEVGELTQAEEIGEFLDEFFILDGESKAAEDETKADELGTAFDFIEPDAEEPAAASKTASVKRFRLKKKPAPVEIASEEAADADFDELEAKEEPEAVSTSADDDLEEILRALKVQYDTAPAKDEDSFDVKDFDEFNYIFGDTSSKLDTAPVSDDFTNIFLDEDQ